MQQTEKQVVSFRQYHYYLHYIDMQTSGFFSHTPTINRFNKNHLFTGRSLCGCKITRQTSDLSLSFGK